MRITWYGHAAFLIETRRLPDHPRPVSIARLGGYEPVAEPADLVVVSHENDRYHSHLGQIVPPFETIRALELPPDGDRLPRHRDRGRPRLRDRPSDCPRTRSRSSHFRSEDLHLVFLGDLGHPLTEPELAPLRGADIVLAAAGGPPTIDYPEIPALLEAIGPRVVIPMHYKTPRIDLNIQPVERFLESLPGVPVLRPGSSSIEIARGTLPDALTIVGSSTRDERVDLDRSALRLRLHLRCDYGERSAENRASITPQAALPHPMSDRTDRCTYRDDPTAPAAPR